MVANSDGWRTPVTSLAVHNPVEEVLLRTAVLHGGWSLVRLLGWKGAAVWSIHQLRRWSWNGLRKASRGGAGI